MEENITEESAGRRPGRRTVIKGAAAGVVGVWALPVVTSFTSPAYAGDSAGNPNPECQGAECVTFVPGCSTADANCICTSTSSGGGFCVDGYTSCASGSGPCTGPGLNQCQSGELCLVNTCCGYPVCIPQVAGETCPPATQGAKVTGTRQRGGAGTIGG